jgi:hypothetical protein
VNDQQNPLLKFKTGPIVAMRKKQLTDAIANLAEPDVVTNAYTNYFNCIKNRMEDKQRREEYSHR